MITIVRSIVSVTGVAAACDAVLLPRATFYRLLTPKFGPHRPSVSPRALGPAERQAVLDVLHEARFVDQAPAEVFATLLDEDTYVCSIRTMYRVLAANSEVRERRDQLRHPAYAAPELLATRPNELWSWDITKLLGKSKWLYFHLYVIIDVFSRMVVGWMIAPHESAVLAEKLIRETCERQGIAREQLTLHADRGSSMKSTLVAMLLSDLGVIKTHSRPHVSNDNPYSESAFKTMKYRPGFPERFGSIEDARAHFVCFFDWYNEEHHHEGLGLLTPSDVHSGNAVARIAQRTGTLNEAYRMHPERFVRGAPHAQELPSAVWINKPKPAVPAPADPRGAASVEPSCPVTAIAPEPAPAATAQEDSAATYSAAVTAASRTLPPSRRIDSKRIAAPRNLVPIAEAAPH